MSPGRVPATVGLPSLMGVCFPHLHCSGSRLLAREQALSCVHFLGLSRSGSGFRVLHKSGDSVGPAFCAFPLPCAFPCRSSSGSQELEERTFPGCGAPYPLRGPSLFPRAAPCVSSGELVSSCDPPGMSAIQNLRKSLVRNWRPVCSVVGDAISGAPFPSPLPPASSGEWASPPLASSSLELFSLSFVLRTKVSSVWAFCRLISPLSCYPAV